MRKIFSILVVSIVTVFFGCGGGGTLSDGASSPSINITIPSNVSIMTDNLPFQLPITVSCSGKDLFNTSCRLAYVRVTVDNDYSYDVPLNIKLNSGQEINESIKTFTDIDLDTKQFIYLTDNNPSAHFFGNSQFIEVLGGTKSMVVNVGENVCGSECACPAGGIWNGKVCEGSISCPTGAALESSQCLTTPTCVSGYIWNGSKCINTTPTCPAGGSILLDRCVAIGNQPCPTGYTWDGTQCAATPTCPAGGLWSNGTCTVTPTCAIGSTWDGNYCSSIPTCQSGYIFNNNTKKCEAIMTCPDACVLKKNFSFNMPEYTAGTLLITDGSQTLKETGSGVLTGGGYGTIKKKENGYIVEYEFKTAPAKDTIISAQYLETLSAIVHSPIKNLVFFYGDMRLEQSENNTLIDASKKILGYIDKDNRIVFISPIGVREGVVLVKYTSAPYNIGGVAVGVGDGINKRFSLKTFHGNLLRESLKVFTENQEGTVILFRESSGEFTVEFPVPPAKGESIMASYVVTKVTKPFRLDFFDKNSNIVYSKTITYEVKRPVETK